MVRHVPYVRNDKIYQDYYCAQVGHGLPVFIGGRHIRGRGLGSLLGGIGRSLIPLLKSGGKALLREGAKTGLQVAGDVLSGDKNFKSAFRDRAKQAGKRLLHQAVGSPPGEPARKRIKRPTSRKTSQKRRGRQTVDIFH